MLYPAAIDTIFSKYSPFSFSFTLWNELLSTVEPSPNWPYLFCPDVHTVPSDFSTNIWFVPAAISITFFILVCVGSVLLFVSPNPNWPLPLYPHVYTVPFPFNAAK